MVRNLTIAISVSIVRIEAASDSEILLRITLS